MPHLVVVGYIIMMILVLYLQTPCGEFCVIYASFSGNGSHIMILVYTYRHRVGSPVPGRGPPVY